MMKVKTKHQVIECLENGTDRDLHKSASREEIALILTKIEK